MRNIGIVIQGPIISQGFDTTATIKQTIEEYLRHPSVLHIVLSTWQGESFVYSNPRVTILHSLPPSGRDVNNRRRQWMSTLQGIKRLRKYSSITHILKVRTDQYVPSKAIDYMNIFYMTGKNKNYKRDSKWKGEIFREPLLFSCTYRTIPFFIGDFYFAGHIDDLQRLMENNLNFQRHIFQRTVEIDLVLKHLFRTDTEFPLTLFKRYIPMRSYSKTSFSHPLWQYWHEIHKLYFACFPKSILSEVVWRGMKWADYGDQRLKKSGAAQLLMDTHYDFASHWQLLRNNEPQYKKLPREHSVSTMLTKREWLDVVRGILESFFISLP